MIVKDNSNKSWIFSVLIVIIIGVCIYFVISMEKDKYNRTINNDVKVTYNVDGNIYEETRVLSKNNKVEKTPSTPIKEGYVFKYWEANGKVFDPNQEVKESIVVNAVFEKIEENDNTNNNNSNNSSNNNDDTSNSTQNNTNNNNSNNSSNNNDDTSNNTQNNTNNNNSNNSNNSNDTGNIELKSISFSSNKMSIKVNSSITLNVNFNPVNATNKNITWESNNSNVASVTKDGVVRGLKTGNTIITAKSANGLKASVEITVTEDIVEVSSITINTSSSTVNVGKTLQLNVTYNPTNAINKSVIWSSSDNNIATVSSTGLLEAKAPGTVTITALTPNNIKASVNITVKAEPQNYAEVYFVNTYDQPSIVNSLKNDPDHINGYNNGQAIIIKTLDNKYILLDTSFDNSAVAKAIYNKLKELQGSKTVKINYLIISHSHNDHAGSALRIIDNSNITVSKLIMKKEGKSPNRYNSISSKFSSNNIVDISEEGKKVSLGKYLEIYVYNTKDVYASKNCHDGQIVKYSSNLDSAEKLNGKYYYFDGSAYPNVQILSTTNLVRKEGADNYGMNNYFYALFGTNSDCNANSNSLAILMKVKTDNGNRYMYFPGDLDNGGYDVISDNGVYGNGSTFLYTNVKYSSANKIFTGVMSEHNKIKSETNVAKRIKKLLDTEINNLVIYQTAHHGYNNAPDAIDILNLNRNSVYAIFPTRHNPNANGSFQLTRTYYYTLKNAKKMKVSGTTKAGVACNVKNTGSYSCSDY